MMILKRCLRLKPATAQTLNRAFGAAENDAIYLESTERDLQAIKSLALQDPFINLAEQTLNAKKYRIAKDMFKEKLSLEATDAQALKVKQFIWQRYARTNLRLAFIDFKLNKTKNAEDYLERIISDLKDIYEGPALDYHMFHFYNEIMNMSLKVNIDRVEPAIIDRPYCWARHC